MSVAVEVWQRKPFFVEAVQVTEENIEAIAEWCKGRLTPIKDEGDGSNARFIKVNVKNPMTARQTKAFVGDWVLRSGDSFKVYKHESFFKVFNKTDLSEIPEPEAELAE